MNEEFDSVYRGVTLKLDIFMGLWRPVGALNHLSDETLSGLKEQVDQALFKPFQAYWFQDYQLIEVTVLGNKEGLCRILDTRGRNKIYMVAPNMLRRVEDVDKRTLKQLEAKYKQLTKLEDDIKQLFYDLAPSDLESPSL